jgi:hypothetical protein
MSLVGYDDKTVRSRLTPWDHSTAGALRFLAREKQRVEMGRGDRSLFWLKDVSGPLGTIPPPRRRTQIRSQRETESGSGESG